MHKDKQTQRIQAVKRAKTNWKKQSFFSAILFKHLAPDISRHILGEKWSSASIILAAIPFNLFIKAYFDYRKKTVLGLLLLGYLFIFIVNLIEPLGFNFHSLSLPPGKEISVYMADDFLRKYAELSIWTDLLVVVFAINVLYLFLAIYNGFKKGKIKEREDSIGRLIKRAVGVEIEK